MPTIMPEPQITTRAVNVYLSDPERLRLASMTPDGHTPQDTIRALIAITDPKEARRATTLGKRTPGTPLDVPGQRRGYSAEDYQRALDEAGTVAGAARILGVHRKTVSEMVERNKLKLPGGRG